jgi:hypothetical protein
MSSMSGATVDIFGGTSATGALAYRKGTAARLLADGVRGVALCAALGTSAAAASDQAEEAVLDSRLARSTFATTARAVVEGPERDLATIRELSGLTWAQIAQIFDVDRRSVHLWADGAGITVRNVQNLARVAAHLRSLARKAGPTELRNRLLRPVGAGECALDRLLEESGGVRAERAPAVVRKPPASAIAQQKARRRNEPKLVNYLRSSYDVVPGADELKTPAAPKRKPPD